jgi:hypothetical protein
LDNVTALQNKALRKERNVNIGETRSWQACLTGTVIVVVWEGLNKKRQGTCRYHTVGIIEVWLTLFWNFGCKLIYMLTQIALFLLQT